jgi:DNA-binding MarR family transcriptional regulator
VTRRHATPVDTVWPRLVALMGDMREDWRRQMSAVTGLPFGRVRALRRLSAGPLTLRELADITSSDAPATTVLVNDLEARGLILRQPHPTNRRAKLVSLTRAGRDLVTRSNRVQERPPAAFATLSPEDLAALGRVVDALLGAAGPESGDER